MKHFEYSTLLLDNSSSIDSAIARLNDAGKNGWQVISFVHPGNVEAPTSLGTWSARVWLMREMI
jgi:hypothetical protein